MKLILAIALTAAIATPAAAHSTKASDTVIIKKHRGTVAYAYHPSSMSLNRTQDVYVNGVYAGSDPDWRVRATLRDEQRHDKF